MKIKTVKDVHDAADKIIGDMVTHQRVAYFTLLVDHGEGTVTNLMFACDTPLPKKKDGAPQRFVAVEDYAKLMLLLLKHPQVNDLEYDEKRGLIGAVFCCPEAQELDRLDHPELGGGFDGDPAGVT